jgi:hypothetical protein
LDVKCILIARKEVAKFPFHNLFNWCHENILDNALCLVGEEINWKCNALS